MLMARTDPDRSKAHRGLSLFVVPKERAAGHSFRFDQPGGGRMEGRAIDTLGYRGMHSYEVSFDGWRVPAANLIGGEAGARSGLLHADGRLRQRPLQTAARAIGVMQAAYEAARDYAGDRTVFGRALDDYQLTQVKLARMAVVIQATRQFMYAVARLLAKGTGEGIMEAAMVKAYACRAAEWVTREAMQLHGGMGYAEEFPVSRYFVDARVLSIFEGADELLALKVIARRLTGERPLVPPQRSTVDSDSRGDEGPHRVQVAGLSPRVWDAAAVNDSVRPVLVGAAAGLLLLLLPAGRGPYVVVVVGALLAGWLLPRAPR